jgi:hypothetical protein
MNTSLTLFGSFWCQDEKEQNVSSITKHEYEIASRFKSFQALNLSQRRQISAECTYVIGDITDQEQKPII